MGKGFKRAMAVVALIMMVGFVVTLTAYFASGTLREGNFYMLPLFLGGFGVLMFVGIRLYNPPGMDGPERASLPEDEGESSHNEQAASEPPEQAASESEERESKDE